MIGQSLWAHGEHLTRHREHEAHSGNHYLTNALGLICLGTAFLPDPRAERWLSHGRNILDREILRQFFADGLNYEGSLAYHGLALEICLLGMLLLDRIQRPLGEASRERLERALDVSLAVTRPDSSIPVIGDVDDGHILPLGQRPPRSQAHLLALGGALYGRSDLVEAGRLATTEIRWLRIEVPVHETSVPHQEPRSIQFPQGGLVVLRSASHHLTIDCGDPGSLGRGGHGHSDLLSFEAFAHNRPVIVDAGTYCYTADGEARNRYRSTKLHNTLLVDGRETLEPDGLWAFRQTATPRILRWSETEDLDVFSGEYEVPGRGILHCRTILFDRTMGGWLIEDKIRGIDRHALELRFHVPSTAIEMESQRVRVDLGNGVGVLVERIDGDLPNLVIAPATASPIYLTEHATTLIAITGEVTLPARCLTALVPYEGQCPDRAAIQAWARDRAHELHRNAPR